MPPHPTASTTLEDDGDRSEQHPQPDSSQSEDDAQEDNTKQSVRTVTFDATLTEELVLEPSGASDRCMLNNNYSGVAVRVRSKDEEEHQDAKTIIFPWYRWYKVWWAITVAASLLTLFFDTYVIAFGQTGQQNKQGTPEMVIEFVLLAIFIADILVTFHLAYYDEQTNQLVVDRTSIAKNYLGYMFWIDLMGVFPFYYIALAAAGALDDDSEAANYWALFRLAKMVRLHRVKQLFDIIQYSTKISLFAMTLTRNFSFVLVWTHFWACLMHFVARQMSFDQESTWNGGAIDGMNEFEVYITSLYWSIVTFTTVGYGDYSPVNSIEQCFDMVYMLINIIFHAWIIGSITLLVVKNDEQTGQFRERLATLSQYAKVNHFEKAFEKKLKKQIKLDFHSREVSDEVVLQQFPTVVRRRILRRLYLPALRQTSLLKGVRQQFVDAFLSTSTVEIFGPDEEILLRGSVSSDLYLVVAGQVKLTDADSRGEDSSYVGGSSIGGTSFGDKSEIDSSQLVGPGQFLNDVGFFTESPNADTAKTKTVCKTLTMCRTAYVQLAHDHPGSVEKILKNLLNKIEKQSQELGSEPIMKLPKKLAVLNAGSEFDDTSKHGAEISQLTELSHTVAVVQNEIALANVRDLVKMHLNKQKDDNTNRFLFAASRGDASTLSLMCDQGFDPNNADYDSRTALMVAAMKGNTDAVVKLLEYNANPNLKDVHGSSALLEAAKNGHDDTIKVLMDHGGVLGMEEAQAASVLCQAVFDGDVLTLRRLLTAGISVNASDYDKRAAVHIAAAEGNVSAMKALVEFGADLKIKDRWNNTVDDEAKRSNATQLLDFLRSVNSN